MCYNGRLFSFSYLRSREYHWDSLGLYLGGVLSKEKDKEAITSLNLPQFVADLAKAGSGGNVKHVAEDPKDVQEHEQEEAAFVLGDTLPVIPAKRMLNKNTQGAKKGETNQKQQLSSR